MDTCTWETEYIVLFMETVKTNTTWHFRVIDSNNRYK